MQILIIFLAFVIYNFYGYNFYLNSLKDDYNKDGFVVVPNLLDENELRILLDETIQIARGKRGLIDGLTIADDGESDIDVLSKYLTLHFPHKVSQLINDNYIGHSKVVEILTWLIGPNVKAVQSMLFIKKASKPGQAWHQDENFIPTRDRSLLGVWIALDDATIENGCLWVIPGSHKDGILYPTRPHNSTEFDHTPELYLTPYEGENGIAVEVKKGTAIFFNGYLHHRSLKNRAPEGTFRRALVNHYMSAESLLPWNLDGKIEMKKDFRDIILVSGVDPYQHEGIEDITKPFLRKETAH